MKSCKVRTVLFVGILLSSSIPAMQAQAATISGYRPPGNGTTGPYRRVYSNAGYSFMSSYIHLPGKADIKVDPNSPTKDTPYVYTGGWGQNGSGDVDAGFQYSPTNDWWTLFIVHSQPSRNTDSIHFKANQDIFLKFFVPQDNQVSVTSTGIDINGVKISRTLNLNVSGWSADGSGNVLKRMTTIAQAPQKFNTGSVVNGVRWYGSTIGTSSTNNHPWTSADTGGYQNWPNEPTKVIINYVSPAEETDNIRLVPVPEPSSWLLDTLAFGGFLGSGLALKRQQKKQKSPGRDKNIV